VDHPTATHSAKYGWVSPRTSDAWRRCIGLGIDVMANVSGTRATSSDPNWVNTLRSGRMPDVPAFTQDDLLVDRELPALVQ
jgi:hypothetical protein